MTAFSSSTTFQTIYRIRALIITKDLAKLDDGLYESPTVMVGKQQKQDNNSVEKVGLSSRPTFFSVITNVGSSKVRATSGTTKVDH